MRPLNLLAKKRSSQSTGILRTSKLHFRNTSRMASSSPIPIALYGRNIEMATGVAKNLLPEYDGNVVSRTVAVTCLMLCAVVYIALTMDVASEDIPKLVNGDTSVESKTGAGSNLHRSPGERLVPKAVLIGTGVPTEESDQIRSLLGEKTKDVAWVKLERNIYANADESLRLQGNAKVAAEGAKQRLNKFFSGSE
jgi:hypothetical protein